MFKYKQLHYGWKSNTGMEAWEKVGVGMHSDELLIVIWK